MSSSSLGAVVEARRLDGRNLEAATQRPRGVRRANRIQKFSNTARAGASARQCTGFKILHCGEAFSPMLH
jgi:hypothetical protein